MALRSKYAVTLYEILEGYVNRQQPVCVVEMDELRRWLKVPENAYPDWRELKKRVVGPAITEINKNTDGAGFKIAYEGLRDGRSFTKIKFIVTKTDGRQEHEAGLVRKAQVHKRRVKAAAGIGDPDNPPMPTGEAIETFRLRWPGLDPYEAINRFQDKWRAEGHAIIRKPDAAFLKFSEGMLKARAAKHKS